MNLIWDVDIKGFTFIESNGNNSKLEELYSTGKAKKISENKYLLPHNQVAVLDKSDRELLELPEIFPYRLKISTKGILASRNFRYSLEYLQPNGFAFIEPKVIGSFIEINDEQRYTFNLGQYVIVSKIIESNHRLQNDNDEFDIDKYNFLNFSDIKEAASCIDAEIDLFIKNNNVIIPKKISIIPRIQKNGDIFIDPVLMNENGEEISNSKDFATVFNSRKQVKSLYAGNEGFYLIEPEIKDALKEVKEHHRIKKSRCNKVLKASGNCLFFSYI